MNKIDVPDVVVAAKNRRVVIGDLGDERLIVTAHQPVDLGKRYDSEALHRSAGLKRALEKGWLKPYSGEDLPEPVKTAVAVPELSVRAPKTSVPISVDVVQEPNKPLRVEYASEIPDPVEVQIAEGLARSRELAEEEKRQILARQLEDLKRDGEVRSRKKPIPQFSRIAVNGDLQPEGTTFKAPKTYKEGE